MSTPTSDQNKAGCDPVSSNCVIWQGPDIPCIKLCKGDSISDITYKLAVKLCDLLDQLDITTYDLTCFNPICPTLDNFHDLIQFLIDKICELQGCCNEDTPIENGCPDCVVNIAACFQYVNPQGDLVTTMQLTDYVQAIGAMICGTVQETGVNTRSIENHEVRIKSLEDTPPPVAPTITLLTSCLQAGSPPEGGWPIATIVATLETAFCELRSATGLPTDIYQAISKQCPALDSSPQMTNPSATMASIRGWITQSNYTNLSHSINNMWLAICDIRSSILSIKNICCNIDCADVEITMTASVNSLGTVLSICFTGFAPAGFQDCSPSGNMVTLQDSAGNVYNTMIPVITSINQPCIDINLGPTPINGSLDILVTLNGCWQNIAEGVSCGRILTSQIINTIACPSVVYTPSFYSIAYTFNNLTATPITYTIEIWDAAGVTLLSSQTSVNPAVGPVAGTFSSLTSGTTYKLRVKVTIDGADVFCPFTNITTLTVPCPAPTAVSAA